MGQGGAQTFGHLGCSWDLALGRDKKDRGVVTPGGVGCLVLMVVLRPPPPALRSGTSPVGDGGGLKKGMHNLGRWGGWGGAGGLGVVHSRC